MALEQLLILRAPRLFVWAISYLALFACKPESDNANDTQFAAITDSNSEYYLKKLYAQLATTQTAELCIGLVGFDTSPEFTERGKNYSVFALRSLRRWLNEVKNSPSWANKSVPAVNHREQNTPCLMKDSVEPGRFSVTFFATQALWVSHMCSSSSPYPSALDPALLCQQHSGYSLGTPGIPAVYISPYIGKRLRHPLMEQSLMHEFGHSFGLGDTYNDLGVTYKGTMADSLMNYGGNVELYPDDKAGLETAIAFATGKGATCEGNVLEGTQGYLFCNPSKEFLSKMRKSHERAENQVAQSTPQPVETLSPNSTLEQPTSTPPSTLTDSESYLARIQFKQATWLKSNPAAQGDDLPPEERCRIPEGMSITVRVFPKDSKLNHNLYKSEPSLGKIAVCNDKVGFEGYFFIPHVLEETKL